VAVLTRHGASAVGYPRRQREPRPDLHRTRELAIVKLVCELEPTGWFLTKRRGDGPQTAAVRSPGRRPADREVCAFVVVRTLMPRRPPALVQRRRRPPLRASMSSSSSAASRSTAIRY
jgi:hypothetical protein